MSKKNLPNKLLLASCPVIGFVAFSGTGKTTLLKKVISKLNERGLRLGIIKHAHHDFDIDIPGKDSYELRKSGAEQTLVASRYRWALVNENIKDETEPVLETLLMQLNTDELDLVLVEGFKHSAYPKIELHRALLAKPFLYPEDDHIIAIATDTKLVEPPPIKTLDLNQTEDIVDFIFEFSKLK
jgi:molybdopterin-guanine dinucleotide biosynthesis protein MobB